MSRPQVPVFETTLQKTIEWLKDIQNQQGEEDLHKAYIALRAVLHALRDRLPIEIAVKFGAQLPMLVRGFYYEGWKPISTPIKVHQLEDFLGLVGQYLPDFSLEEESLEEMIRSVFRVIARHISSGEIFHILQVLPNPIASLWPLEEIVQR